ncbi:hypothetical protein GALMADRAFT_143867 [Galerina marginata CBS 339.88]|uniref:Uncharacterized protein n=1 Tax=Galerina marginata (strain CBS 339.88) TaxID=685588 RepID=A0A067SXX6_GALM3|nr:hypothetical protein GALMADRAFT_143867 [Galerina marginata CBS 339.88]
MEPWYLTNSSQPFSLRPSANDVNLGSLLDASADYMRKSSTPGSPAESSPGNTWLPEPLYDIPGYGLLSSSPPLSCPPSWLQLDGQPEFYAAEDAEHTLEKDIQDSGLEVLEVPLSSSPPDLTSSSPRSTGSGDLERSWSSSLTSASTDSLLDSVSVSQLNPSLTSLPTGASVDDFGQRLHQLLLIALKERELERLSNQPSVRTQYSLDKDSTNDCTPEFSESPIDPNNGLANHDSIVLGSTPPKRTCFTPGSYAVPSKILAVTRSDLDTASPDIPSSSLSHDEISPIQFEIARGPPIYRDLMTQKLDGLANYRVIKRAQSYVSFETRDEPVSKRQKTSNNAAPHAKERIYARRTASLRRADSLKSVADSKIQASVGAVAEWPPTVPTTPIPSIPLAARRKLEAQKVIKSPIPIIAPPLNHVAALPLDPERLAKRRLACFLDREADGREMDGLSSGIGGRPPSWMLETMSVPLSDENDESSLQDEIRYEWEAVMGIGSKTRKAVVSWLLEVLPVRPPVSPEATESSSPCSSLSSSTSTSRSECDVTDSELGHNLFDQLQNSPETRFHAVWMFLRFFSLAMPVDSDGLSNSKHIMKTLRSEAFKHSVWNTAVACLAISVKFHRDFLEPLIPVFAQEYVSLAPHSLSYERLETAHRDILGTFDYRLGVTPQPVMDQLWFSLSSLRTLLHFDGGWACAMRRSWTCLYDCLVEPDVQRFPVSMLTVAALMEGIIQSLMLEYRRESPLTNLPTENTTEQAIEYRNRAIEISEGVFCDIQGLIGFTDVQD